MEFLWLIVIAFQCINYVRSDCFYDAVSALKGYDKQLCGRLEPKNSLIASGSSYDIFKEHLEAFESNGTEFSCECTRDWLMEIGFGLSNNYFELKENQNNHSAAGYVDSTGNKLLSLFDSHLGVDQRVFYEMQIIGPLDHVWLVEQLADGPGYRIYQSYSGAYSLNAWLNNNASAFEELWNKTDIIDCQNMYDQANAFLQSLGYSINQLDELPQTLNWMKSWLLAIREYNKTQIFENLHKGWEKFGAGRIMSKEYFYDNYLKTLANMTEEIKPLVNTTKPWTQKLHDQWISLFGSPNPLCYPGAPFNTLTGSLSQDYKLEVKVNLIPTRIELGFPKTARVLMKSVNQTGSLGMCDLNVEATPELHDCFLDAALTLKPYDKLLCGRLDPKKNLIRDGMILSDFIMKLDNFKSNGTEFSCGYTRDWLMEMAFGLVENYNQLKANALSHEEAGFNDATGQKLKLLFDSKLNNLNRVFYQVQIVGPLDHVWLIEQLPRGAGYRVYQSYNGAYSLDAWLTRDAKEFDRLWNNSNIIYWQKVYDQANNLLKSMGLSMDNIDALPEMMIWMKPWLTGIKNYNKAAIIDNLMKAWLRFGGGRTLSQLEFYERYVTNLVDMTEEIKPLVNTTKPWTQKLHDQWISLFGSPNPLCYPGAPFNTLTGSLSQDYKLEVKVKEMNHYFESDLSHNVMRLKTSVNYAGGVSVCEMKNKTQSPNKDCFFSAVNKLKKFDKKLCGRLDPKNSLINANISADEFIERFTEFKSNGTEFVCGLTRDWLMEMAFGLTNNYNQLKNNFISHSQAGFVDRTGNKLKEIFDKNLDNSNRIFYQMQIVGPLDHVWLIEQLGEGAGYRVYQSYNGAYSLNAWLENDEGAFDRLWEITDIIYWNKVYEDASNYLKSFGYDINKLEELPSALNWMKPWLTQIKSYNKTEIIENLKKSWKYFGGGKVMSQLDFYKEYLLKLSDMTEEIKPLVSTAKPWTQKLHDQWISFFASPNPLCYPDVPFNTLTGSLSQDYKLEVKVVEMTSDLEFSVGDNAEVLAKSVGNQTLDMECQLLTSIENQADCFFDAADGLKNFDKKLCGRLDPKNELIRRNTSFETFLNELTGFKSNGTEFSCGYTRDWLMELAFGLKNNYEQLKLNQVSYASAGFLDVTGTKLKRLFDSNLGSNERIFYQMQIIGPLDHVWLIEQLANRAGYRVYQSYNGAYSLAAWLEKNSTNFGNLWKEKEIIYWQKVYKQADEFLKSNGLSIDKIAEFPPALSALKPWLNYIKDYNETLIIYNLKKAWTNFGAGKILSEKDFYVKYLKTLADLSENIIPLVSTSNPWTEKLHDQWISLFASPNPLCYPDVPFNTLTASLSQNFQLQAKVSKMTNELNSGLSQQAGILQKSVDQNGKLGMCNIETTVSSASEMKLNVLTVVALTIIKLFF